MLKRSVPPEPELNPRAAHRYRRADATRKRALSPIRILFMVLALPLTTALVAVNIYLRTSEYERNDAIIHLVAMAGCDTVLKIVPGPFVRGQPGYHERNDPNGDGVACGILNQASSTGQTQQRPPATSVRSVGNAKFVRP